MRRSRGARRLGGGCVIAMLAAAVSVLVPAPAPVGSIGSSELRGQAYIETEFDGGNTFPEVRGPALGLQGLESIVVTPDGSHVYAAGSLNDAIVHFSRDPATGALTPLATTFDGLGGVVGLDGVQHLTSSPDGRHLYAVGRQAGTAAGALAVFTRDPVSGALGFVEAELDGVGGVDGLGGVKAAAVSPDGNHVYAVGGDDDAIVVFQRDPVTGALTFLQALFDGVAGVDGLDRASDVGVSPDGRHVYTVAGKSLPNTAEGDDAIAVFARDTDSLSATFGSLTFVEALFDGVGGVNGLHEVANLDISPDGNNVYTAAETDGALSPVGPNEDWLTVFYRDGATGRLTYVWNPGTFKSLDCGGAIGAARAADVVVSPKGDFAYVTDPRENAIVEYQRTPTGELGAPPRTTCRGGKRDGSAIENEFASGFYQPSALGFDPSGANLYVGGFSPAAVTVFGTPSFLEIVVDAVPDNPQVFQFFVDLAPRPRRPFTPPFRNVDELTPLRLGPLEPGVYNVSEVNAPGLEWALTGIDCVDPSGGTTTDLARRTASMDLGVGETVTCTFTHVPTPPDADDDGVGDDEENGAPNGGDANRDGVKDSQQGHVASLRNAVDGRYVTIVAPPNGILTFVKALPNPDPANSPPGVDFPFGFFSFRIIGSSLGAIAEGSTIEYTYIVEEGGPLPTEFYFHGPEPGQPNPHFFPYPAAIATTVVKLTVVDGQRGDGDLTANGVIVDPGAPAVRRGVAPPTTPTPTPTVPPQKPAATPKPTAKLKPTAVPTVTPPKLRPAFTG